MAFKRSGVRFSYAPQKSLSEWSEGDFSYFAAIFAIFASVKQVVLILSFLLSLFSGGRTELVDDSSSQDVLCAVTEDQSHEDAAGYAQNRELCITAAQGYSFSSDSNPNSVSIRVTQSGRRTQSQVRSTVRIIKSGKVIDNNHSYPFLAESIVHQAGMYVPQRYLFSICRLRL